MPCLNGGASYRYNIDGIVSYLNETNGKTQSYTQLFRNGIIEAVDSTWLEPFEGKKLIPSTYIEQKLIESLTSYLDLFRKLSIEPPIFVFLNLLGVKGYYLSVNQHFVTLERQLIDRDDLLLSENIIENLDTEVALILKPCFDSLWNAGGFPRDLNYNAESKWRMK
jgi:hypothetical protein